MRGVAGRTSRTRLRLHARPRAASMRGGRRWRVGCQPAAQLRLDEAELRRVYAPSAFAAVWQPTRHMHPFWREERMTRRSRLAVLLFSLALAGCSDASKPAALQVGVARRDITPNAATAPPDGSVYLGGYGFGPERPSSGVLQPISVRAFVISGEGGTVAFAANETQGAFAAYRQGLYGHSDVAAAVEQATGGAIPRQNVIVSSVHSHAGPDTTGVWGGLPDSYLAYLRDQTIGAILDAYAARRDAELWTGRSDATDLITSQFHEPPNDQVDGELRVLLATEPGGDPARPFGVLINYAAHATV